MNKPKRKVLLSLTAAAAGMLAAATAVVAGASAHAATQPAACARPASHASTAHVGHIAGIVHATAVGCAASSANAGKASGASDPAKGTPPLIYHGGKVMGTPSTGPVVITPIYWHPAGHPMDSAYKHVITTYLSDVAHASHRNDTVFSVASEYYGTNGTIHKGDVLGTPVNDTSPLPADGCTVAPNDGSGIYSDNSGYDACLDDDQVIAETNNVVAARHLPVDYAHIYVLFLPKHVESCFFAGSTLTADNACTINNNPSAAYCAYHSQAPSGTVYANMPYPIYESATHFTCGTNKNFGTIESPNGNKDADVQVSPTSHEINEAVTDPDTTTGWYDSSGFENGDECAYIFGATHGAAGQLYNQTINGHHYLTQEEFSNNDFAVTGNGCVQGKNAEAK